MLIIEVEPKTSSIQSSNDRTIKSIRQLDLRKEKAPSIGAFEIAEVFFFLQINSIACY